MIASGLYIVLRERSPGTSSFKPVLRTRPRMEAGTVVTASGAPENSEDDDRPDRPLRPH